MKLYIKILLIGCLSLFWACEDFLAESSQDEVRPSTVRDMEQLLKGEIYIADGLWNDYFSATDMFTDDIQCNGWQNEKVIYQRNLLENKRWNFSWDKEMYTKEGGGNDPMVWEQPYRRIKGCNVVLEYLDKVTGNDNLREYLRGEAYAMRGYYYFNLVNLFGEPYNVGDPTKNLGVPLKLRMGVTDELFTRNTVAEVYKQIESDWLQAVALMKQNESFVRADFHRMSYLGVWAMLSRLYLYQENWDKAILYADSVLTVKPELLDLASLQTSFAFERQSVAQGVYNRNSPAEIIWACRTKNSTSTTGHPPFAISKDLYNTYTFDIKNKVNAGDLRAYFYFQYYYTIDESYVRHYEPFYVLKDLNSSNNEKNTGIRTSELYLTRAEVNIQKFMKTGKEEFRLKALSDLNLLRKHRFDTRNTPYEDIDIADAKELYKFYQSERRRELCGEGYHRWFDLRRFGKPELSHFFFMRPGESEQTFILEKNSPRYLLPIPEAAMNANSKLQQNP